jgi:isopentenyl-diphosphate delta-isomerase
VEFQTRTTGLERYDLPYRALPETDLAAIRTDARFMELTRAK